MEPPAHLKAGPGRQARRAADGARRCTGNVKMFEPEEDYGVITFGRTSNDVYFSRDQVPKTFLEKNNGDVPAGIQVEFDLIKDRDGNLFAEGLTFPSALTMAELGLKRDVVRGASSALGLDPRDNPDAPDLISPAPVQAESIPKLLAGEDLVIAAETGSGKTLAYALPLVQQLQVLEKARSMDYGLAFRAGSPLGLVVCPTRELALQACRVLKLICYQAKLRVRCVHGGVGTMKKQRREISQVVDLLVATPDRCLKFYRENDIRLTDIAHVTIDEADFMLTQGFADLQELLQEISQESKFKDKIRYTLVTASITKPLWKAFQDDPRWSKLRILESRSLHRPQANCSHVFLPTKGADKLAMLISLMRPELAGAAPSRQTLVFCNTIAGCRSVSYKFREAFELNRVNRFIGCLHKEMKTEEREQTLGKFARGELKLVICTDIAQRGLDLPNCGHIINFDFPLNSIDYLHRAGRTARYGEPGKVTSLVKKSDKWLAKAVQRSCHLGKPIDNLSADKRDYLRGGALHDLIARHPRASAAERGLPAPRAYDGSLR